MNGFDQSQFRFGTAGFADRHMIAKAGLYKARNGLFIGNDPNGRPCFSDQMSAVLLNGGARSGKNNFIIPWLVDGHYSDHIISMDWKGQNGNIAQLQVLQNRRVINFAPRGGRDVESHRINPISYIHSGSPTLIPDAKMHAASFLPLSGSENSQFFEATGQRWIEAVMVQTARLKGNIAVNLPVLADIMAGFGGLSDEWLFIEEAMSKSPDAFIRQVAVEIQNMRSSGNPNAGGFAGAKGEIAKAFSCMSDPQLRASLSPPFDFCFSELVADDASPYLVNIMEAHEFAETSAPVIKALYTCALIYKRRNLGSRPQVWNLDEIGNINKWPLAVGLATYGAGYGIRPVFVTQSMKQLDNLAPNASKIISNSCGTQIYMGIRSHGEAQLVSQMLGVQTLEHEDFQTNEQAKILRREAMLDVVFNGADPFETGVAFAQQKRLALHKTKIPRKLLDADEIMNQPEGTALVFMPGILERPLMVQHKKYWQRRDLAGRYLRDPYHSPEGKVEVRGVFRQNFKPVITEHVPDKFAELPQYSSGYWSYVQGYRPQ